MAAAHPPPTPELAELLLLLGPSDTRELVRTFLHDTPQLITDLADGTALAGGPTRRQIAAHSMKSTSRLVGANTLGALAALLEQRLSAPGEPATAAEIEAIRTEFTRVEATFTPFLRP